MFEAILSSLDAVLVPSRHLPNFDPDPVPDYPKTTEEAFRRDWEAIGGDMFRAIEKVKADDKTGQDSKQS